MFEIDIEKSFSAAHTLVGYKGDCSKLHGHNWLVQAFVVAEKLDEVGIAVDFKKLKKEIDDIISEFDHSLLNDLDYFKVQNPTSEKIAEVIYKKLAKALNDGNVKVSKVRVCESLTSGATYSE